ncbi:MAG TPA: ATP-binding protein, partial [Thauera sp.]|nr:ATP-binding protein [Thauera sp.]
GELLTLSRLEAGGGDAPLESLDLMDLIAAIADDARFEAEASGRRLHFEGQGEAIARVRGELMHRAFENVIRNAVKYTAEGSQVDVTASVREGVLQLCVGDRGPGLPESDLEAVFEPFHRGSNGQSAKGFGLGLAIARRAVETHGGQIRARNRDGGGLELEIMLPLQREA